MAVNPKLESLAQLLEAYGIGVRAGVITPCVEDEIAIRAMLGLPVVSEAVRADWESGKGVRRPITLSGSTLPSEAANPVVDTAGKEEGAPNE